jgi:hypothetical protein
VIFVAASVTARNLIPVPPGSQVYLGAYVGLPWYDANVKSAYSGLESKLGRKFDVDRIYNIFNEKLPFDYHKWTASQGRIPFISLVPITSSNGVQTRIPWGDISAGKWDGYLREIGTNMKNWGAKIFFCFHHEPDLDATCPGDTLTGCDLKRWHGTSSQFKAAYAHIRSLYDGMGLNTLTYTWVMTQMNWNSNLGAATKYYPGPGVVDWISLDVYNFISSPNSFNNWAELGPMITGWYKWASTTGQPLMLAEWGCKEYRPNPSDSSTWNNAAKPNWFLKALGTMISDFPKIKSFVYFHKNQVPNDWRVDSSSDAFGAFNKLSRDPAFNWWKAGSGPTNPSPQALYKFNFQPSTVATPSGYLPDTGGVYGSRNGLTYGWDKDASSTARVRSSSASPSAVYDTLLHLQLGGASYTWEVALPNNVYTVKLIAGDASFYPGCYAISLEGTLALSGCTTSASRWITWTGTVSVKDGRLTVSNTAGKTSGNKINAIEISSAAGAVVQSSTTGAKKRQESGEAGLISGDEFLGGVAEFTGQPLDRFTLLNESYDEASGGQTFQYIILDGSDFEGLPHARSIAVNLTLQEAEWAAAGHSIRRTELLDTVLTPETAAISTPEEPVLSEPVSYFLIAASCAAVLVVLFLVSVTVYQALRIRKLKAKVAEAAGGKAEEEEKPKAEPLPSVTSQTELRAPLDSEADARVFVPATSSEEMDPESGTPSPMTRSRAGSNADLLSTTESNPSPLLKRALAKLLKQKPESMSSSPTTRRMMRRMEDRVEPSSEPADKTEDH